MPIRIKNTSSIKKLFGLTKGFGAFANNAVLKSNPQLLSILTSKKTKIRRIKFKKKCDKGINSKLITKGYLEKQKISSIDLVESNQNKPKNSPVLIKTKTSYFYMWKSEKSDSYYKIYLQPNFFGHWSVASEWGGTNKKRGAVAKIFDRYEEALDFINHLNLRRQQEKYKLIQTI